MNYEDRLPAEAVKLLVERHGPWPVVRALMRSLMSARRPLVLPRAVDLSDHLRRDIGLPVRGAGPFVPGHE